MNIACARVRSILTFAVLVCSVSTAWGRPLLVAPQRPSLPPLVQPEYPGQYPTYYGAPAIDGDTLIVPANRVITTNERQEGVYLFERTPSGSWNYVRPLVEGVRGDVVLNGNLAVVQTDTALLIFERGAQGWALTDTLEEWELGNNVFRIDDGSLYVRREVWAFPPLPCQPPYEQWRRVNGTWSAVATIGGERCNANTADVNDGRALVALTGQSGETQAPAHIYAATGAASWPRVAQLRPPPYNPPEYNRFGYAASLSGSSAYIDHGWLYRNTGGNNWVSAGRLLEPESELSPVSQGGRLRGNTLLLLGNEADYEVRSLDWELSHDFRTLRAYRKRSDGSFAYYAKLNADFDVWFWSLSEDGRRVAAAGPNNINGYDPVTELYVFEIPDAATFNGTQQDTFESNNFSRWTATAGQFAIATNGATRVLRQSSLAGNAGAHLTAVDWADQSIEADLRPLEFDGAGRWFGLVTRRTDASNFYYVTLRAPGTISLRRMRDGVVTELAYTGQRGGFTVGRNYRVRLESVGDQHVVYIDGVPRVRVKDTSLTYGHPGVAGYRTRFEVDNVVVSNASRMLVRFDSWEHHWSSGYYTLGSGSWEFADVPNSDLNNDEEDDIYVLKQTDTAANVRWFSKTAVGNQVVSARVRPVSYGATTSWFGIAAQVKDAHNYYYITMRRSNQLSLRRLVNGTVQVLATVPQPVSTGAWYDLRLEIVGTSIRAFVNGDLKIHTTDPTMSGAGRNALLMYKTAADWESYIAYHP